MLRWPRAFFLPAPRKLVPFGGVGKWLCRVLMLDAERMTVAVETDSMRTIAEGITERLRGSRIEALHFDDRTGYMAISLDNGLWLLISVDWGGYSLVVEERPAATDASVDV